MEKQSYEMLELINEKRSEYMMAESLYVDSGAAEEAQPYPSLAPQPAPPALAKFQLYQDPQEFAHVDQIAISVSSFFERYHSMMPDCASTLK